MDWWPTIVATTISGPVAYAAIAWLLRLVAQHPITVFIRYRSALAALVAALRLTGAITATWGLRARRPTTPSGEGHIRWKLNGSLSAPPIG